MDGLAGVAGWRWIFLMEGVITVVLGIAVPFLLADTPERAKGWLSDQEKKYLKARMTLQEGGKKMQEAGGHFSWKLLWSVFSEWQIYIMVFNYWSNNIPQVSEQP
jgi:MFS family permease